MKEFNLSDFHNYLTKNYYNPNKSNLGAANYTFPECVYAFGDLWLYTVGDVLYTLRITGFQIGYDGKHLYFISANEQICSAISVGDKILDVHFEDNKKHIKTNFVDSTGTAITTYIRVPDFSTVQPATEYMEISFQTAYIKICSFSNFDVRSIEDTLKNVKYLFIDLRDNMGGSVNDMIKVLSNLSNCNHYFNVEDSNGRVHSININKSFIDLSNIKAVNFRVNELTASSAEMFAITLRSIYPGRIYGERTTGKLVIQDFVRVSNSVVAVPVYHFRLPIFNSGNGVEIDECSKIVPDVQECPSSIESTFVGF